MRTRNLILILALILGLDACKRVDPPGAQHAATSDSDGDNAEVSSWTLGHICTNGLRIYQLQDGSYAEFIGGSKEAGTPPTWTKLSAGVTPQQLCGETGAATNDVQP